ncbi:MAG: flagellar hook assembly protein FlgD [Desulfobacterales bacterium]
MAIEAISQSTAGVASGVSGVSQSMGKDAFLKLLITQLQHQDPLNPADSTEFTAQLAQFSSLEQLSNINTNLGVLKLYQASINNAQAVGFIGKEIVANGNTLEKTAGRPATCEFELPAEARRVVVTIYDAAGGFVKDIDLSGLFSGSQAVAWDGTDRNGGLVPDGAYRFEVQAEGLSGAPLSVSPRSRGVVTGVVFEDGITYLITGQNRFAIGDVLQVGLAPQPTAAS